MEMIISKPETKKLVYRWENPQDDIVVRLVAQGAGIFLSGVFMGSMQQRLPITIEVRHEAPETTSRILVRGVVKEKAHVSFRANALLQKGAKGADASIDAKALLLSDEARCELQPDLEIDEQDVRATHATFVGPLDEEEIFYLMSRGVPEERARALLIQGFLKIPPHNFKAQNPKT